MNPAIVVVGSLNMDFVVTVDRVPAPGETVIGRDFQMIPGGKGANQACAAAKLAGSGVSVRMIGRVGYDLFADHLKASLSAAGVDVTMVHATKAQPTGVALIWVDRDGQNSIVVASGANYELSPSDAGAMRPVFRGAKFVLFQLETPLNTVEVALTAAREEGTRTILDPAPGRSLSKKLLSQVDVLTPNESEACLLLGRPIERVSPESAPRLAQQLRKLGPETIILKLGEQGCYYLDSDGAQHVPGYRVYVRDSTAAGDTFNAALAVALTEGQPLSEALPFANAAAAISVTRLGAQASVPSRHEVEEFLSRRSQSQP
jgi:ribokinase